MSEILDKNREYATIMKDVIRLRGEPVAVKLIPEGEDFPQGYEAPADQVSHCQAVFRARAGESFKLPIDSHSCKVGTAALGMTPTGEKVASGEFHFGMGMHDTQEAVAEMIAGRVTMPGKYIGEVVCPLKDADFVPDVVVIADIPERIYWVVPLSTADGGGRAQFSTAPFQCACEDIVCYPLVTGAPNISLGCFGCRKKSSMAADELACGIPYGMIPAFATRLTKYADGVMQKAKRD